MENGNCGGSVGTCFTTVYRATAVQYRICSKALKAAEKRRGDDMNEFSVSEFFAHEVKVEPAIYRIKGYSFTRLMPGGYVNLEEMVGIFNDIYPEKTNGKRMLGMAANVVVSKYQWCVYDAHLYHEAGNYEMRILDKADGLVYTISMKALALSLVNGYRVPEQVFVPKTWFDLALQYCQAGYYDFSKEETDTLPQLPLQVGLPSVVNSGTEYPDRLCVAYGNVWAQSRYYMVYAHR
jgi:hypothetical protein